MCLGINVYLQVMVRGSGYDISVKILEFIFAQTTLRMLWIPQNSIQLWVKYQRCHLVKIRAHTGGTHSLNGTKICSHYLQYKPEAGCVTVQETQMIRSWPSRSETRSYDEDVICTFKLKKLWWVISVYMPFAFSFFK